MPRERSLLERLRDPQSDRVPAIRENTARLADSVLANLERLLKFATRDHPDSVGLRDT